MENYYFMDDEREAQRLDTKVDPDVFIDDFIAGHIPKDTDLRILDAGCGAGMIAATLAKRYPKAQVTGVDISKARLAKAQLKAEGIGNATFVEASINQLPLEDQSMDFVYTRFLLEYLPDPFNAIKELYRVCKPGGTVVLQDLDAQLVAHFPHDILYLKETLAGLAETGFDPYVGRKLYNFGKLANFEHLDTDIRIYHKVIGEIDEHNYKLWKLKLDIAMPKFVEILGEQKAQAFVNTFLNFLQDEDSIMYSNLFTVYLKRT